MYILKITDIHRSHTLYNVEIVSSVISPVGWLFRIEAINWSLYFSLYYIHNNRPKPLIVW